MRTTPLPLEFPGGQYLDQEEIDAVTEVLRNKSPFRYYGLTKPNKVDTLEQEFAAYCGREHALGVNSGSAALSVALAAMEVGPGQEVLVPGYMWVSTVSAVVRAGAIPVLVDVDDTFCMDPEDLERKITRKTTAVIIVHMSGAPGRLDELLRAAKAHGLTVLADCAQANGSRFKGTPVGAYGDMAIFSFQLNKTITAGEGGIIVCDEERLYKRAFACHDMGYFRNQSGRLDTSDEHYQLWGQGSRLSEISAAVVHAQFHKMGAIVRKMHDAKYVIKGELEKIPGLGFRRIMDPDGDIGSFLITLFKDGPTCIRFTEALRAEGIATSEGGVTNIPMTEWSLHLYNNNPSLVNKTSNSPDGFPWTHPANKDSVYDYHHGALPVMDGLFARSSLLAVPSTLTGRDIEDIVSAFRKVAEHIEL